ncbi:hypothetical protein Y032_0088g2167 [Ancylostoma ceylanicum]|uniref:Uncharacterized protein n=1 Tax=Ancylostoma ceylanicum TaxID=53326 RepID=A0A016TNS9_9BILA|nr:hypothetical protein Y032_0088g2167 [Ancylostoma ceylanicum]
MVQRIARSHNVPRIYTLVHDSPYPTHEISDHVYDELKKVLILAGAFFFITIVCIMSKLQVIRKRDIFYSRKISINLSSNPLP